MDNRPPSRFGAALIHARKQRNISQYRLAQLMGRSTRYLNNIEQDRYEPRFSTILLFAKALQMDPGELVSFAAQLSWAEAIGTPLTPMPLPSSPSASSHPTLLEASPGKQEATVPPPAEASAKTAPTKKTPASTACQMPKKRLQGISTAER